MLLITNSLKLQMADLEEEAGPVDESILTEQHLHRSSFITTEVRAKIIVLNIFFSIGLNINVVLTYFFHCRDIAGCSS